MIITVGIAARHVHLTKDVFKTLFGYEKSTIQRNIKQPGLYAAAEKVTIKTDKGEFQNVRVLGPERDYNQVEISKTDAHILGLNPKVRKSGDVKDASEIEIIGPVGSVKIPAAIIAERHIHITKKDADKLGVKDGDTINVKINGEKPGIIEVKWKVSEEAYLELHLDLDDANAFLLEQDDEVEVLI